MVLVCSKEGWAGAGARAKGERAEAISIIDPSTTTTMLRTMCALPFFPQSVVYGKVTHFFHRSKRKGEIKVFQKSYVKILRENNGKFVHRKYF